MMIEMEKKEKLAVIIIIGLLVSNFGVGAIGQFLTYGDDRQGDTIERIFLFSIDGSNPEYLSPTYMPMLYSLLKDQGIMFQNAWAPIAAQTMNGHTTMLTGCYPNSTGIIGNSIYIKGLSDEDQPKNPVQDPKYRFVNTIFEDLKTKPILQQKTTGFVSGKWRLPSFLSQEADFVFAAPNSKLPLCPSGYESLVGYPLAYSDGDLIDQWIMTALTHLVYKDDPQFVFINLAWSDVVGHDTGSLNPNHARVLRAVDANIMQFIVDLKSMGKYDSSLFIFTGDHGMESIYNILYLGPLLSDNEIAVDQIHIEGHSAFIFLTNPGDTAAAVSILKNNEKVAVVLPRNEMHTLHLDTDYNRTGDIYISAKDNIQVVKRDSGFAMIGTHGGVSCRDVPLAFMGPTIKKGEFIQETIPEIADIVPTIYDIWGLTVPNYMDGRILHEIFV